MGMIVRKASQEDRNEICRIHQAAARGLASASYSRDEIEAWVGSLAPENYTTVLEHHDFLVAESGEGLVGFGQLNPQNAEIEAIYVLPAVARSGVGRALLLALEAVARRRGFAAIHLYSTLNATGFYEREGYKSEGQTQYPTRSGTALPVVRMVKSLASGAG